MKSLEDAGDIAKQMTTIVDAWRIGDTDRLEREMIADLADLPELYASILADRNADWAKQIEALTDDDTSYLIVVGTLHLVGPDSVQALLAKAGYPSRQLRN